MLNNIECCSMLYSSSIGRVKTWGNKLGNGKSDQSGARLDA